MNNVTLPLDRQITQWQELDAQGFSLIPLYEDTKKPFEEEWTHWCRVHRSFSPSDFLGRNAGICCGPASGILVIDVDNPSKFEQWIVEEGHRLPGTRTHRTGSGKLHYLYQYPQDGRDYRGRNHVERCGFEIRGLGQQIVAPGSIHPDTGEPYIVEQELPIAPPPAWLVAMANSSSNGSDTVNVTPPLHVPMVDTAAIRELPVSNRIKALILTGAPLKQRSEAQASVLCALLAAGVEEARIFGIFEHHAIGEKYREKGATRLEWLAEDMARASAFVNSGKLSTDPNLTDTGNAERLVRAYGPLIRYCPVWKAWMIWDEKRWCLDERQRIRELAKETAHSIYADATLLSDKTDRSAKIKHAMRTEDSRRIAALVDLAKSDSRVVIMPDELDQDPWLLNLHNGSLNLNLGLLQEHSQGDLITKLAGTHFDAGAGCPMWLQFLDQIMDSNQSLVSFLQRAVGYTLTGQTREQVLFFLYGTGANGKTTFLNVITALMGEYAKPLRADALMARAGSAEPYELATLKGARLVPTSEIMPGRSVAEGLVKQITGEDVIKARHLYQDFFEFKPEFKIWLAANEKPTIRGQDYAIWRRIMLIPFAVTIPEDQRDKELTARLLGELPGILNWALEGCRQWQESGLQPPDEVKAATGQYKDEMDLMAEFLEERCICHEDFSIPVSKLYSKYCEWCDDMSIPKSDRLGKIQFGRQVEQRPGVHQDRTNKQRAWRGIGMDSVSGANCICE